MPMLSIESRLHHWGGEAYFDVRGQKDTFSIVKMTKGRFKKLEV
jgi:hypothetical protein